MISKIPALKAGFHIYCYISQALTPLQTVRYMKHTCTLAKLHVLAKKSHGLSFSILGLKPVNITRVAGKGYLNVSVPWRYLGLHQTVQLYQG